LPADPERHRRRRLGDGAGQWGGAGVGDGDDSIRRNGPVAANPSRPLIEVTAIMSHDAHHNHATARRRAFTALELSLSLGLGAIVALCAVSLTSATGRIWQAQQQGGIGTNTGQRTESYLERALRQAQNV